MNAHVVFGRPLDCYIQAAIVKIPDESNAELILSDLSDDTVHFAAAVDLIEALSHIDQEEPVLLLKAFLSSIARTGREEGAGEHLTTRRAIENLLGDVFMAGVKAASKLALREYHTA